MSDVTYAYYPVFRGTVDLRERPAGDLEHLAHEAELLFKEWTDRVTLRASYSTVGFRPDAELLLWLVATSPDDVQELMVQFRRTGLGRRLDLTHAFMGVVRPAGFSPDH